MIMSSFSHYFCILHAYMFLTNLTDPAHNIVGALLAFIGKKQLVCMYYIHESMYVIHERMKVSCIYMLYSFIDALWIVRKCAYMY